MNYFESVYKGVLALDDQQYNEVEVCARRMCRCGDPNIDVGSVVSVEPKSQLSINESLRKQGAMRGIECHYALITSRDFHKGVRFVGFMLVRDIPYPITKIIDGLHREKLELCAEVDDLGESSQLVVARAHCG